MKKIKTTLEESNPGRVAAFAAAAQIEVKNILDRFKDWEFYTGESRNDDGMVALLDYREDGVTPYMLFWKDGLKEEKVVCTVTLWAIPTRLRCFHNLPCLPSV